MIFLENSWKDRAQGGPKMRFFEFNRKLVHKTYLIFLHGITAAGILK